MYQDFVLKILNEFLNLTFNDYYQFKFDNLAFSDRQILCIDDHGDNNTAKRIYNIISEPTTGFNWDKFRIEVSDSKMIFIDDNHGEITLEPFDNKILHISYFPVLF